MTPGFADAVLDSQATFRALMEGMARPGRVQSVGTPGRCPEGLARAAAATLLTLADADTLLWTDAGAEVCAWVSFHTGARFTVDVARADFLLAVAGPPDWSTVAVGSEEAPQEGATVILQLETLEAPAGWRLSGPGIEEAHHLAPGPVPTGFLEAWRSNGARFPRGFDLILAADDCLVAVPRTTRIEEAA
jgi:alpha-D-ribose 1-methylphosphonate 5-triphosphate synthase subunit PhnH